MKYKTINKAQLTEANNIARTLGLPRHFTTEDFDHVEGFHKRQEWPILFSVKKRKECWRILFEHDNGELYQLDVIDRIYEKLTEKVHKVIHQ